MSFPTKNLGELCEFQGGSQPAKSNFVYEPTDGYVRFLQIRDFGSEKNHTYIPVNKKNKNCNSDDIMIGRYGASVGKILRGRSGAYNVALMKASPVTRLIDKEFFWFYLNSYFFQNDLRKVASRSAQDGFSKDDIFNFQVPLPSLATQQKIVAKLDAIFAEIDTATAAAEANAKNAEALFQSYLTEVFERKGKDWETKKLCEISSFDKNQGIHNGIPYIGMENIQSHTTQLISGVELIDEVKSSTFKFNETHLLYGRLRPYLNKVYAPNFVGHCSTEIFPIKPFSNLLRDYLKYWFINVKTVDKINATCTGARMPRANMNAVMNFDFPLPSISIQKQLIEYFDSVQNSTYIAIDSYKTKISEITALKQSILQKAFNGELVKD